MSYPYFVVLRGVWNNTYFIASQIGSVVNAITQSIVAVWTKCICDKTSLLPVGCIKLKGKAEMVILPSKQENVFFHWDRQEVFLGSRTELRGRKNVSQIICILRFSAGHA